MHKSISKNRTILLMLVNFAHVCLPAYPNTSEKSRHNKAVILPDFHSLIVHTKQNIYGHPDGIISELESLVSLKQKNLQVVQRTFSEGLSL